MTETLWGVIVIGGIGALLTFARRFKNKDSEAGGGVVAWTFFLLILWLFQ